MNNKIAFIGAGKMVSAIVKSLISSGTFVADEISCCSANDGTSKALSEETGILGLKVSINYYSLNPIFLY